MPRKKTLCANTLKEICLIRIARDVEKFWFPSFQSQFKEGHKLLFVLGPFDHITGDLIQNLIETLGREKLFRTKYFQLLLGNRLIELNLKSVNQQVNSNNIAQMIGNRCQRLTKLNLEHCNSLSAKALGDMVAQLPRLQHLNLSVTKTTNKVMEVIGNTCQDLVNLDVSNTSITEKGLDFLNMQSIQPGSSSVLTALNRNKQSGLVCSKLKVLRVSGTPISDDKKVFKFLAKRTNLVEFSYDGMNNVVNIFCEKGLFGTQPSDGGIKGLDLRSLCVDLSSHDLETSISSLLNTVTYCQKLVCIKLNHVSDHHQLLPVIHASSVVELSVQVEGSDSEDIFLRGLRPVLEKIGSHLKSLDVIKIKNANLAQVGALCPNLEKLFLVTSISATFEYIVPEGQNDIFQNLKSFRLIVLGRESSDLNESLKIGLKCILSNAKGIESVTIDGCDELDDQILFDVVSNKSFKRLNHLMLDSCNSITSLSINQLLTSENDLTCVQLHNCWNISRKNWEQFQQEANMSNYDLTVDWS